MPPASGWRCRATTRHTAPGRCDGWWPRRSATGWPGRCCPARSATARACWSTGRRTGTGSPWPGSGRGWSPRGRDPAGSGPPASTHDGAAAMRARSDARPRRAAALVELDDDGRVVAGALALALLAVDRRVVDPLGEGRRGEDEVDAHA